MAQKTYAGIAVDVNDEGYLTNAGSWTNEIAVAIAQEEDIVLTEKHFAVLYFIRQKTAVGEALSLRSIGKSGIVDAKQFYELFPGAPLKKASRIAGIPKPSSCV
ncbi:MAG TPA: TusE/DsrC/DsvC family sulfur relay protein [Bacteroidales bacterium]|nr:TusE/DsrC/DsvC family sulfur relay protein [Bacteroidales bacterium]